MEYQGCIDRPPEEARSLLVQVRDGVARDGTRSLPRLSASPEMKSWAQLDIELGRAAELGPAFSRVFLCDGDALVLTTPQLERLLTAIRVQLPWVAAVSMYGDALSVGDKSLEDLRRLHRLGLDVIYDGIYSGDEPTMQRLRANVTYRGCLLAADKLRDADIAHSVMVTLGVGGRARSAIHATETARLLTDIDPQMLATLTTTTAANQAVNDLAPPEAPLDRFELLEELHAIIDRSDFSRCAFSALHPSNHLRLRAQLPEDRTSLLRILADFIDLGDPSTLRPSTWPRSSVSDGPAWS
ncbi:MAG: radical SAM protein [Myxococcota bacterium]